jgi:probable F420-dependent oxidoreductase
MKIGVVLPQQEIGMDASAIREWAVALERLGVAEIEAFDHVLGGDPAHWADVPPRGFQRPPYTTADAFHEPLVLFAHLAAVTSTIGFATSVLVLPQRQTALVAKQAAEVDVLSGGRLRLGVGVGWNAVEYDVLGAEFAGRGQRVEEQIAVLRALWAKPVVDFEGRWHRVDRAGINPLPTRRSMPIWIGGVSEAAIGRVVRCGDGWAMGRAVTPENAASYLERLDVALAVAGRSRDGVGLSAWLTLRDRSPDAWAADLRVWADLGVERVGLVTRGAGNGPEPHLALVERFFEAVPGPLPVS